MYTLAVLKTRQYESLTESSALTTCGHESKVTYIGSQAPRLPAGWCVQELQWRLAHAVIGHASMHKPKPVQRTRLWQRDERQDEE